MKVLQINSVCGYGSTGKIMVEINQILNKQGHSGVMAFGRGDYKGGQPAIKIGNSFDNNYHAIYTRLTGKTGFASYRATVDFIDYIKKFDFDVIHMHNIHGYYINLEVLFDYLKSIKKPVIWTLHDCWAFTGHCTYFDISKCEKWKNGCNKCPQKSKYPSSYLLDNSDWNYHKKKELFNSIDNLTIVTPSRWLADLVSQSFLRRHPIKVINNGIDLKVFKPTKSNFKNSYNFENRFIILGVASIWGNRKGYHDFIKLSNMLDENYQLVMVGTTEKQAKELPTNILAISRTSNVKELVELYSMADVFFNPTYEDNFPTTNIESLACGTPVVTYKTGGSPEAIDASCGLVIEQREVEVLRDILNNFSAYGFSNQACINRAKLFDNNKRFGDYINLYKSVCL